MPKPSTPCRLKKGGGGTPLLNLFTSLSPREWEHGIAQSKLSLAPSHQSISTLSTSANWKTIAPAGQALPTQQAPPSLSQICLLTFEGGEKSEPTENKLRHLGRGNACLASLNPLQGGGKPPNYWLCASLCSRERLPGRISMVKKKENAIPYSKLHFIFTTHENMTCQSVFCPNSSEGCKRLPSEWWQWPWEMKGSDGTSESQGIWWSMKKPPT